MSLLICHVLGIGKEVKGEYQGYSYCNRTVYVSYEDMSRVEAGVVVERFKVPTSVSNLKGISVGSDADFVFNRYGKIIDVKGV